jgi:hypothetical protein
MRAIVIGAQPISQSATAAATKKRIRCFMPLFFRDVAARSQRFRRKTIY